MDEYSCLHLSKLSEGAIPNWAGEDSGRSSC
jgi:hypothetical protein